MVFKGVDVYLGVKDLGALLGLPFVASRKDGLKIRLRLLRLGLAQLDLAPYLGVVWFLERRDPFFLFFDLTEGPFLGFIFVGAFHFSFLFFEVVPGGALLVHLEGVLLHGAEHEIELPGLLFLLDLTQ